MRGCDMKSIEKIARKIVMAGNGNVLEDYYKFYNDGKWVVDVVRRISKTLLTMGESMTDYSVSIPKLEECLEYIEGAKLGEMDTASCAKELRDKIADMKKKYDEWEKADSAGQAKLSDEYKATVLTLRDYILSYEKSCVNMFRNRYIDDEENVRNLLDIIHKNGNAVMNNQIGKN